MTALYYVLPLPGASTTAAALLRLAVTALLVVVLVMMAAVRGILAAPVPELRAVETVTAALALFLTIVAAGYHTLSHLYPARSVNTSTGPGRRTSRSSPSAPSAPSATGTSPRAPTPRACW